MNDFFVRDYNQMKTVPGTYVLMQDVDRYDDIDYQTKSDAIKAMESAQNDGKNKMWVGIVEDFGDGRTETIFCCGESA